MSPWQELLDVEPGAKWPLLTLVRLDEVRRQVMQSVPSVAEGGRGASRADADIATRYAQLIAWDPMRRGYYEDAVSGKAVVVAKPRAGA
jgi:geranylgeranyl transferase type-2 subunit alpha